MRWVLVLALVVACNPEQSTPPVPDAGADASNPATGRWYGTIIVDSYRKTVDMTPVNPQSSHSKTHVDRAHTRITISDAGARHVTSTAWLDDDQHDHIVQQCVVMDSTNSMHASATKTTDAQQAYFVLTPVGDSGYAAGEFASAFLTDPVTLTSHNRLMEDSCGAAYVDSSDNSTSAPLTGNLPLDKIAGTLSADKQSATGSARWTDLSGVQYRIRWSLKRDKEIVAVVDDQTVQRLATVNIDGSKSRGTIDTYEWTFDPGDECEDIHTSLGGSLSVGKEAKHSGETDSFQVLCKVDVHLHVSGPAGEDDDDATITVTPRQWSTDWMAPYQTFVDTLDPDVAGSNRCFEENGAYSGHYIHTMDPQNTTWKGSAYKVAQIDAGADGPFAGAFYTDDPQFHVHRTELINIQYLPPKGTAYVATSANDSAVGAMLATQIEAHESEHSKRLKSWLDFNSGSNDPAMEVEPLASADGQHLTDIADATVRKTESDLCYATSHPFVKAALAELMPSDPTWNGPADI